MRRGSSSRENLRRPIRAGKRPPKSYAGAEAIIPLAMAQGMAGRMHGRLAGAAPMHLVDTAHRSHTPESLFLRSEKVAFRPKKSPAK